MLDQGVVTSEAEALRRTADERFQAADYVTADDCYEELHRRGQLRPGDARQWVQALRHVDAQRREVPTLRQLAEEFPDDQDILEFVAAELWQRAETLAGHPGPDDEALARDAWATALKMAAPGPRSDDEGVRLIGLLDRFYQAGRRQQTPIGSFTEFEQALVRFAAAGPHSALRAADLLAVENPGLALELVAGTEANEAAVLVQAIASCELDDFAAAAALFDHLEATWGTTAAELDVEDRSHWIQAMTDIGRFAEAERACRGTIAAMEGADVGDSQAWSLEGLTPDNAAHWRHAYLLLAFRLATQQGRYRAAWDHLRAAQDIDDAQLSPDLRRSVLRVRLVFADQEQGVAVLSDLAELATADPYDTTYAESCLWAGNQWGTPPSEGQETPPANPFADARYRGQAAARALLTRAGTDVSSRQRLRLALLAGDDDRAAALLAAEPLTDADPWTVKVLAAMLALRQGDDLTARSLLDQVLPHRRHDLDLRVLDAQAALMSGEYKTSLREAMAITEAVPEHVLARTIQAESEFEAALAMADVTAGNTGSVENVQQLLLAVGDYRRAADLHCDTKAYLETGRAKPGVAIGSEPLAPRLYVEVCRRGLHAAILAQEGLDRLGLRGDAQLVNDAQDLVQHLRSVTRPCCRKMRRRPRVVRLVHQLRHVPDRDEASRLAVLMIAYRWANWTKWLQNLLFFGAGAVVAWLGLADILPQPSSDTIRAMVLGLGVLLMLMPFARSLKVGVVELSRDADPAPLSGRSKSLRTSRVLLRVNHLGTFALPSPPDKGRRAHKTAQAAAATQPA